MRRPDPSTPLDSRPATARATATINGAAVICALGTLTNGGSATVNITFQPTQAGMLSNTASASANEPDRALFNNVGNVGATVSVPTATIGNATVVEGNTSTSTN